MEEHFPESEDLMPYARAYESLGDAVTISNLSDSLVFINRAGEELYGYARSELVGRPLSRILPVGAQFVGAETLQSSPNEKWEGEVTIARKGGQEFPAQLAVTLLRNDDGAIIGTVGIVRDLTETRQPAEENAVLAELGRIIGSTLDIDQVYERFAEEVWKLIPFDRISIATVDLEASTLTHAHVSGVAVPGWGPGDVLPLAESVNASSVASISGQLLESDPKRLGEGAYNAQRIAQKAGLRSGITVPLLSRGVVVGTLNLRSKQADAYAEQDLKVTERVAAQVAGAIANSELHRSVLRDAKERAILAEIGRTISSTLDIDEVYSRFAERVGELIQVDRININLLVSKDEDFTTAHVTGVDIPGRRIGEVGRLQRL